MPEQNGCLKVALVAGGNTAGSVLALANPEGAQLLITRVILNVTTGAGGAFTADCGVAANGTTSSDTLLDGVSIVAASVVDNINNGGTNGKARQLWGASEYITITPSASIAATAFAGNAYIQWVRV